MAKSKIQTLEDKVDKLLYENRRLSADITLLQDHNARLLAENTKIKGEDSSRSIMAKLIGVSLTGAGMGLPAMMPDNFGFLLVHFPGEKFPVDLPVYSILGLVIIFWPQVVKYAPVILKYFPKITFKG